MMNWTMHAAYVKAWARYRHHIWHMSCLPSDWHLSAAAPQIWWPFGGARAAIAPALLLGAWHDDSVPAALTAACNPASIGASGMIAAVV